MVEQRGWETYVNNPPRYCRRVVDEFYAGMNLRDYQVGTHTNLKIELGVWNLFISHSLRPRTHYSTVSSEVATLLYCIEHEQSLNVGHIVKTCIVTVGESRNLRQPLLFPYLITEFCRRAGVDFMGNPFEDPMTDIGMGTWTTLKIKRDPTSQRRMTGKRKIRSEAGQSSQQ
ncbi:hypothetical protein Q3G72_015911 [Acer saccharum]|nr:hypothetical protein Q3G72_015911 [Acer saccharum]